MTTSSKTSRKSVIISICLDEDSRGKLWACLNDLSGFEFIGDFQHYLGDKDDFSLVQALRDAEPNICLLDFDANREHAIRTAEQLQEAMHGKLAIFAVSAKADPELIISAMRCGCTEYLLKPLQPERLADSLQKVGARKQEKAGGQQRAQVVSFVGVKGGSGVTAIAIHLATFLARMGRKTLLIDHHPDLGDAALYLGFSKHRYNFYELINNIHRLDTELLEGFTLRHESGLEMLASAEDFGLTPHVSDQSIQDTIGALKGFYQTIVVDCPPGMSEYNIAAVEQSDRLYLVATPEVPSIRNLVRYLDYLSRCNYPPDKMLVVINRYSKRGGITDQQIEKAIRRRIHLAVPNSYAEVIQAINTGQPVLPNSKSELARVLSRWSSDLTARGTAADSARAEVAGAPQKRGLGILGL